ncbi:hypothetical protein PENTCL1PPCAC_1258 [Pristionchus entomophagus]|uniref:Uncharacterized protein n=1 Tax=Pristionchus entomophagus TaxID=358040 RepID=A0AAV5S8N6_9BILA|nr:hypothetical protein PENTCL1PPCAC_1258 [Pristionchus entomophagus]
MALEPQRTPIRVAASSTRPARRSLFSPRNQKPSQCSPTAGASSNSKPRSSKIELQTAQCDALPCLGAESAAFGDDASGSKGEKAKRKTRRGSQLFKAGFDAIKQFASKKSKSAERTIEDESDYDRAFRLAATEAEMAMRSLRAMRFSIGDPDDQEDPWDGYEECAQRLHEMESCGYAPAYAAAEGAESELQQLQQLQPSLAEWMRIEIDTTRDRRRVFYDEVDELCGLLRAMDVAETPISSVCFHTVFSIMHHLHPSVEYDEDWATVLVQACRVLHEYSELRRVVVLLLQMTSATTIEMDEVTENIRTLLLRETVGECTQWSKLYEWQRDVICCLLMRRHSRERKHGESPSSTGFCGERDRSHSATLHRSTLTRKGGMRPGAEEALRDAGIMDARCREVMEAAARDLGKRLEAESARPVHGLSRPIFFPSIKQ